MNAAIAVKPRRFWLYLPFMLLLLAALGWSALWFYGRHRINAEIDDFFAREASLGREWSCPDRSIAGFPFRIEGRCRNPTYRQTGSSGEAASGALKGLTVVATTAGALDLGHVITEFEGPLTVRAEGFAETTTTWRSARSSIRGGINRLERFSLEVEAPVVTIAGQAGQMLWKADRLSAHLRETVNAATPGAYDVALRVENASAPYLDALMNSRDPVNLTLDAAILKPGLIDRRDWRQTVENWRDNGGALRIVSLSLSKGLPRVEASGDLKLDDMRRPEGRLEASFVNAGAILQQFGIGGGAGGLLGGLLGGIRSGGQQRDTALRLPLLLENGRVAVGPFRIPGLQLRPVF